MGDPPPQPFVPPCGFPPTLAWPLGLLRLPDCPVWNKTFSNSFRLPSLLWWEEGRGLLFWSFFCLCPSSLLSEWEEGRGTFLR